MIGEKAFNKLKKSKVAVFGLGGVGSYATEALVRSGIENISVFDGDKIEPSNINRQLIADTLTVGEYKTEVMKDRILKINPSACVQCYNCFFSYENEKNYDFSEYDYIVDAIDTISSKILIIEKAEKNNIPIISCMGTGNKINPLDFEISDIYKTSICPLARVMRRELKKRNIKSLKVVYSKEKPLYVPDEGLDDKTGKRINASIAFVPSVAGLILAGEVIKDIINFT